MTKKEYELRSEGMRAIAKEMKEFYKTYNTGRKCKVCGHTTMENAGMTADKKIKVYRCVSCGTCYLRPRSK